MAGKYMTTNKKMALETPVEWRQKCFSLVYDRFGRLAPACQESFNMFMDEYIRELVGPEFFDRYYYFKQEDDDYVAMFYALMTHTLGGLE